MSKIYRSGLSSGIIVMLFGSLFMAFGVCAVNVSGLESVYFFGLPILFGFVVGILGGLAMVSTRVVIDERGIAKSTLYGVEFVVSWDEVESWSAGPISFPDERADDSFTVEKLEFRLQGSRKPVIVYASEVWRPGMEQFLADVRAVLQSKERRG